MDTDAARMSLTDREQIIDIANTFAWAIDHERWDEYGACLDDELEISLPVTGGWVRLTREELIAVARQIYQQLTASQHLSSNHRITVSGDEATCVSTLNATHYLAEEHEERLQREVGYYEYRLARTPAGWRINRMLMTILWVEGNTEAFRQVQANASMPSVGA
jgi:3-phenylpropionate/cinnamic acid dioxygenase small subunit